MMSKSNINDVDRMDMIILSIKNIILFHFSIINFFISKIPPIVYGDQYN